MHKTMHSLTGEGFCRGNFLWPRAVAYFLGQSPDWYKLALIIFLIVNPLVLAVAPFVAGWLLVVEFIFTLAMALKCYPLLPGGLLAIEALLIGMTSPAHVREEIAGNLEVLLLLMFWWRRYLLYETAFCCSCLRACCWGSAARCCYRWRSAWRPPSSRPFSSALAGGGGSDQRRRRVPTASITASPRRARTIATCSMTAISSSTTVRCWSSSAAFCAALMMHAGVGTALGGVMTMVGEPQNLIIAKAAGWHFGEFFLRMAPT